MRTIQEGLLYRHFKGRYYLVVALAKDANTREDMVMYRALYGEKKLWIRSLRDFESEVDPNREGNTTRQSYRFLEVDEV